MWSYFGAKTNVVKLYPPPKYGKIIEPFAGTARYALRYWDREVLLVDKYDVIVKIWKWLQLCSPADILKLPRLKAGENLNNFDLVPEAKMFMGFLAGYGLELPRVTATQKHTDRPNYISFLLKKAAGNLEKIRHWEIREGSYETIENQEATWFIDPPYKTGGHAYVKNNKSIDFNHLAIWSRERIGQKIVCEGITADWLPFIPLGAQHTRGKVKNEVFWTNEPTSYSKKSAELNFTP